VLVSGGVGCVCWLRKRQDRICRGTENQIKEGAEGTSSAKDEKNFTFEYKDGNLAIPYDQVNDLEYGRAAELVSPSR
jgi:hypothetical protein